MKKQKIQNEWKKIIFESIKNKPNLKWIYPKSIIRNRELLLLGQTELGKIEIGMNTKFHTKIYKTIMKYYFQQKKRLKV